MYILLYTINKYNKNTDCVCIKVLFCFVFRDELSLCSSHCPESYGNLSALLSECCDYRLGHHVQLGNIFVSCIFYSKIVLSHTASIIKDLVSHMDSGLLLALLYWRLHLTWAWSLATSQNSCLACTGPRVLAPALWKRKTKTNQPNKSKIFSWFVCVSEFRK